VRSGRANVQGQSGQPWEQWLDSNLFVTLPSLHPSVEREFDPDRLFLADINGDGLSDVVYEEGGRVRFWINRSGRVSAEGGEVLHTPRANATNARVADLLGTGTAGLVWLFAFSSRDPNNYKYLGFAETRGRTC
jgi:hypothetical protein